LADAPRLSKPHWECQLNAQFPLFGHRNRIVVADSVNPAQSKLGIETTASGQRNLLAQINTRMEDTSL
jgi:hypothetical protein